MLKSGEPVLMFLNLHFLFIHMANNEFSTFFDLVLGPSQFSILSQLPQKMILPSKVVKGGLKIIISLCQSKSMTHSVEVKYVAVSLYYRF